MSIPVGIVGKGTYFPNKIQTAADLVELTGIPETVLREKMGIRQRHIADEADTVTYMATQAAGKAVSLTIQLTSDFNLDDIGGHGWH